MTASRVLVRMLTVVAIVSMLFVSLAPVAFADDGAVARPIPVVGPRLKPPAIPHTSVLTPALIYNYQPKPVQISEAAAVYTAQPYYQKGAGVLATTTSLANGITLYTAKNVCNDFNGASWGAPPSDVWTNWYGGWAPFAVDDGYRQAKNTTFSMERVVGPGKNYGKGYSVKIASNQPYAGGFGSPMIKVEPGATVNVTVKYLIWDYVQAVDPKGKIMDWASMGLKPDAAGDAATYVNGYVRGEWAVLTHSVVAGHSGYIMVLLQGESVGAVNSNIYFDDVQIEVNGEYLTACVVE